jgi:broad specificity phosphatase PhoE
VRGEIVTVETLLYVRHGTSEFNLERRFGGSTDTPLAPHGYEEARIAAEVAAGVAIDCIVSSPLSRCRRTAVIIAERIGFPTGRIVFNELLTERGFGPLEGTPLRPEAEIENEPGVETVDALLERAWQAHAWLSSIDAKHILVCGHGAFGRVLRSTFRPEIPFVTPGDDGPRPPGIPNAVITCWHRACVCCDHLEPGEPV